MKTKLVLLTLLWAATTTLFAQTYPKREFRGAWIQAVNGQFQGMTGGVLKQTLTNQLNALEQAGINAVIFQVRPEADALYESPYEPWSRFLTGRQGVPFSPHFDPLKFMIDECHARGMELHAWINPYRAKTNLSNELAPTHIYHQHPEWFVSYDNKLFFDPALPESRDHICKIVKDIINRYDIDGIHLDDYFYPYPAAGKDYPDDASYATYGSDFANKGDWRRNNVSMLIEQLHEIVCDLKPWVKFGISPFGVYRNRTSYPLGSNTQALQNYDDLYADVLLWLENGWIDYVMPQIYWHVGHPRADYQELVDWWAKNANQRPLFIGQSIANTIQNADPVNPEINQLPRKIALQRAYQTVNGSCHWPASGIINNEGNYKEALMNEYYKYPALVPTFPFIDNKRPDKVKKLKTANVGGNFVVTWTPPKAKKEMDKPVQYVVYCFDEKEEFDLDDPTRIVTVTRNTYAILPYKNGTTKYQIVVTAVDRLHNESRATVKKIKL